MTKPIIITTRRRYDVHRECRTFRLLSLFSLTVKCFFFTLGYKTNRAAKTPSDSRSLFGLQDRRTIVVLNIITYIYLNIKLTVGNFFKAYVGYRLSSTLPTRKRQSHYFFPPGTWTSLNVWYTFCCCCISVICRVPLLRVTHRRSTPAADSSIGKGNFRVLFETKCFVYETNNIHYND